MTLQKIVILDLNDMSASVFFGMFCSWDSQNL